MTIQFSSKIKMGKQKFGFTTQFFCECCDESIDYFHELQNDAKHIFPQCNKFNFYQEIKGVYGIFVCKPSAHELVLLLRLFVD